MMKSIPALLLLEWGGKGAGGKSARFVLKIMYDGGRGLVELGFYEELATHAEGPGAQGKVHTMSVWLMEVLGRLLAVVRCACEGWIGIRRRLLKYVAGCTAWRGTPTGLLFTDSRCPARPDNSDQ